MKQHPREIVSLDMRIFVHPLEGMMVRKSGMWDSMILVLGRRLKSLADALTTVYLLIVTTVCRPGTHATILAVDVSARYNKIPLWVWGSYLFDTCFA